MLSNSSSVSLNLSCVHARGLPPRRLSYDLPRPLRLRIPSVNQVRAYANSSAIAFRALRHRRRRRGTMTDSANGQSDGNGGQAMLASQRAREAGQKAPKSGYFPLGYKEGFGQWVSRLWLRNREKTCADGIISGRLSLQQQQNTKSSLSSRTSRQRRPRNPEQAPSLLHLHSQLRTMMICRALSQRRKRQALARIPTAQDGGIPL